MKEEDFNVEPRDQITRAKLEAMGFRQERSTPNIISIHFEDWADEYIEAYFNDGTENQTIPNQINVMGLNNDVTMCEYNDMKFTKLSIAIWLVYDNLLYTSKRLRELFQAMPVAIECIASFKDEDGNVLRYKEAL